MEKARAHLNVSGRVQGVCFRMYVEQEAVARGVTGWVRNLPNGQVEVLFEGKKKDLEELVVWCRRGPPAARVTDLHVDWEPYHGDFLDFAVI